MSGLSQPPSEGGRPSGSSDEAAGTARAGACEWAVRKQALWNTAPGTRQAREENEGDSQSKDVNS